MRSLLLISTATLAFTASMQAAAESEPTDEVTLSANWGDIDGFWGDIDGFWGDIDGFWGDIDGFWGDIDGFWGDIDGFWGDIDGFWGDIDGFWGDIDGFWGDIDGFSTPDAYDQLFSDLDTMFDDAENIFGDAFEKATNGDFQTDFKEALYAKYNLDPNDPESAATLSDFDRTRFFLEFRDTLMAHSGFDSPDHWMRTARWSPEISREAGYGSGVIVGLLDTPITDKKLIGGKVDTNYSTSKNTGYGLSSVDHGAGVASILAGAHDGEGVMGVAPEVDFYVFNPFDETFTTDFATVETGLALLSYDNDASIINMSLGRAGYVLSPDWSSAFNSWYAGVGTSDTLLVKAAGNSGISQSQDIDFYLNDVIKRTILVGSVNPEGEISSFSNRPGSACVKNFGFCLSGRRLKDRFIVAPGELVLVQDNAGNLARVSGTSAAAPMVSGAAALLQSRWGWLKDHPEETGDILLQTATDLGETGVDEVYGRGLLNIEASQAPVSDASLYVTVNNERVSLSQSGLTRDLLGLSLDATSVTAFEDIGDTYRDFDVTLSTLDLTTSAPEVEEASVAEENLKTTKKTLTTWRQKLRRGWNLGWGWWGIADQSNGKDANSFTHGGPTVQLAGGETSAWTMSMTATDRRQDQRLDQGAAFGTGLTLQHQKTGARFSFGSGDGRHALTSSGRFVRTTSYDNANGGANPFLGFASGGSYAAAALPMGKNIAVTFGFTENVDEHLYADGTSHEALREFSNLSSYRAKAFTSGLDWSVGSRTNVGIQFTSLTEETGLFTGQGTGAFNLDGGSATNAVTLAMTSDLSPSLRLGLSLSSARTSSAEVSNSLLGISENGISSTAFELAVEKLGLLSGNDAVRLSVSQPLHVTSGGLTLLDTQVSDRDTGQLAIVSETVDLGTAGPRYVAELLYARPFFGGRGDIAAFGQYQTRGETTTTPEVSMGVQYSSEF